MGPIHIIFVVLTAAVPGWMYFSSKPNENIPGIKWGNWEDNMEKIVDGTGGFENCSSPAVVRYIRELCERSLEQWGKLKDEDSVVVERASNSIVFSCEVRNDATFVSWRLENAEDGDIKCQPGKHAASMAAEPAFVFNKSGALDAIEFTARNGERQSINAANCRRKLQLTLSRKIKTDSMTSVDRMPRLKSDPQDYVMANRMCFEYDVTSEWDGMRESVAR